MTLQKRGQIRSTGASTKKCGFFNRARLLARETNLSVSFRLRRWSQSFFSRPVGSLHTRTHREKKILPCISTRARLDPRSRDRRGFVKLTRWRLLNIIFLPPNIFDVVFFLSSSSLIQLTKNYFFSTVMIAQ